MIAGEAVHFEEIDLCLETRDFLVELLLAFIKGSVELSESLAVDFLVEIKLMRSFGILADFVGLLFTRFEKILFVVERFRSPVEVGIDLLGGNQKTVQLFVKDVLQIRSRDFGSACTANIFGAVGGNIHLCAAFADHKASKQMNRPFGWSLSGQRCGAKNLVALIPHFL